MSFTPTRRGLALLSALALPFLGCGTAAAQDQDLEVRPQIRPVKITTPPVIDGALDDAIWRNAPEISNFRQTQPVLNADPSERTVVYLAYDDDNLYVGLRAYDSEPDAVVATELRRDADMGPNDHIVIMFDTFADRRNAFGFAMNPVGALHDARVENNSNWNSQWNGIWDGKARQDDEGWSIEMVIPFKTLSFDPEIDTWGVEVIRRIRRKNERMRWANISQNRPDNYVAAFGDMVGLQGLQQGLGLDIVPTFSVQTRENRPLGDSDQIVVTGGDITYRITPSLTAQATINSDFSDAPVDQVQNNLGRFSLFFPETRDFFLNDADIFQFGGLSQENGIPFFSRRMGIINTGEQLDLKFGAKMTGRIGDLNLGMISTHIAGKHELDSQNLSVLRVSTGVLSESRVGMIITDGDANSNNGSRLYGSDFQYRNSNLPGGNVIIGDAWVQKSDNPGVDDDDLAYGLKLEYPNDKVQLNAFFREIQENFSPKLGFVNRPGIRHYETSGRLRKRNDGEAALRLIDWGFRLTRIEDMQGRLQTEERIMKIIELATQANDRVETNYIQVREVLDAPFQISRGVILPPGDYTFERQRIRMQTNNGRKLSGEFRYRWGNFWTGTVKEYEGFVEYRPTPKFFAAANYQIVDAKLPQGNFDFAITRLNLDFNFTPRLTWQNLIQHNSVSKSVGWNSRMRWELQPGNILFLVFNQGWEIEDGSYIPINTGFTSKVRWTFRF
jgi:hypothetical protein